MGCHRGKNIPSMKGIAYIREEVFVSKKSNGIKYICVRCGSEVPLDELELRGGGIKCILCGYRVLKKTRPPVVKRISAK